MYELKIIKRKGENTIDTTSYLFRKSAMIHAKKHNKDNADLPIKWQQKGITLSGQTRKFYYDIDKIDTTNELRLAKVLVILGFIFFGFLMYSLATDEAINLNEKIAIRPECAPTLDVCPDVV